MAYRSTRGNLVVTLRADEPFWCTVPMCIVLYRILPVTGYYRSIRSHIAGTARWPIPKYTISSYTWPYVMLRIGIIGR